MGLISKDVEVSESFCMHMYTCVHWGECVRVRVCVLGGGKCKCGREVEENKGCKEGFGVERRVFALKFKEQD